MDLPEEVINAIVLLLGALVGWAAKWLQRSHKVELLKKITEEQTKAINQINLLRRNK